MITGGDAKVRSLPQFGFAYQFKADVFSVRLINLLYGFCLYRFNATKQTTAIIPMQINKPVVKGRKPKCLSGLSFILFAFSESGSWNRKKSRIFCQKISVWFLFNFLFLVWCFICLSFNYCRTTVHDNRRRREVLDTTAIWFCFSI